MRIDLSYLAPTIHDWWENFQQSEMARSNKSDDLSALTNLTLVILEKFKDEHLLALKALGLKDKYILAIIFENVFAIADTNLGLMVHEAFTKIGGIALCNTKKGDLS